MEDAIYTILKTNMTDGVIYVEVDVRGELFDLGCFDSVDDARTEIIEDVKRSGFDADNVIITQGFEE